MRSKAAARSVITSWGDGLRAMYLLGLDAPRQLEWIPLTLFFLTFVTLLTVGLWLMRWCWLAPRPVQFAQRRRLVGQEGLERGVVEVRFEAIVSFLGQLDLERVVGHGHTCVSAWPRGRC